MLSALFRSHRSGMARLTAWWRTRRGAAPDLVGPDFPQALTIAVLAGLSSTYAAAADIAGGTPQTAAPMETMRHGWQPESETARAVTGSMVFDGGLIFENGTRMRLAIARPLEATLPKAKPAQPATPTAGAVLPLGTFLVASNADTPLQNGNSLACTPGEPIVVWLGTVLSKPLSKLVLQVYPAQPATAGVAGLFEAATAIPCGVYTYQMPAAG